MCAHKLFSCFKWNNLFIHRIFFFYCFEKFIWKYWTGIGSVSGLLASAASRISFPHTQCAAETSAWFLPPWLVCSIVTQDYHTYIHTSSWVKRESKHAYSAFKRKLREREDAAKAFKQDWFCVGIYPTMEVHIYIFSYNYVLFRWKAQRGNFRRPVLELSECSRNQMRWSLSPRVMDTCTFTLHRWTIRSGRLGKLTVRVHTHRFSQHRWSRSVVLATERPKSEWTHMLQSLFVQGSAVFTCGGSWGRNSPLIHPNLVLSLAVLRCWLGEGWISTDVLEIELLSLLSDTKLFLCRSDLKCHDVILCLYLCLKRPWPILWSRLLSSHSSFSLLLGAFCSHHSTKFIRSRE